MKTPTLEFDPSDCQADEALMNALVAGDPEALQRLYDRHRVTLRAVIMRILHDEADADEVLQEVFVQVWQRAENYCSEKGKLLGWLITLARRRAIDRLRQRFSYQRTTERFELQCRHTNADFEHHHTVERAASSEDLKDYLHTLMDRLPPAQREVVEQAFFNGLSQRRIAANLQLPLGTVKTRIELGLRKLSTVIIAARRKVV